MQNLNPQVDLYLTDGCGRCKFYATPECKVKKWPAELENLRQIVLESNLTEELKWRVPVYTFQEKNILSISAFKEFCSINFFKGVLLKDKNNLLEKQGESSQSSRIIKFTDSKTILKMKSVLKEYILEAIEIEKSGKKVAFGKNPEPVPSELENKFDELPELKKAFYALTPGRQRAYIIYFSQPKQSATKLSRIEKYTQKILNGEGLNDNYKC